MSRRKTSILVFLILFSILAAQGCKSLSSKKSLKPTSKLASKLAVFTVNPSENNLTVGDTFRYWINQFDKNGKRTKYPVIFKSLDPNVAVVDKGGNVLIKNVGNAKIKISCKEKSFTVKVDVREQPILSVNYSPAGIIADNGSIIIQRAGASPISGYVVNYFKKGTAFAQTMYLIKNISDKTLTIDPDNFYMISGNKNIIKSANSGLEFDFSKPPFDEILRKHTLSPGKSVEKLVLFKRPSPDFTFGLANTIYDDGKNPKIVIDDQDQWRQKAEGTSRTF